jgi:hypothetical protein
MGVEKLGVSEYHRRARAAKPNCQIFSVQCFDVGRWTFGSAQRRSDATLRIHIRTAPAAGLTSNVQRPTLIVQRAQPGADFPKARRASAILHSQRRPRHSIRAR